MQQQIKDAIKAAMIAKDMAKLQVLRGVSAAFTNEMVSESRIASGKAPDEALSDEECLKVVKRLVKQRKDSIEQFVAGGREDLATDEKAELSILETLLPEQVTGDALRALVQEEINKIGEIDMTKKGQITGQIIKALSDKADGKEIKDIVDSILN
jgi:uncharacterized protein YqeY